jgi:hypothetical protein
MKKEKSFSVGERVRLRGSVYTGTVTERRPDGCSVYVEWDKISWGVPKRQHDECLIRRVKKKRREFWIKPVSISQNSLCVPVILAYRPPNEHDYIHVREVRK